MSDDLEQNMNPDLSAPDDIAPTQEEVDIFATAEEPINRISRGDEINVTHKDPTLRTIDIGVGWDLKSFEENPLDLDASVFLLDKNDLTRVDEDFVFYNSTMGADGAVKHHGDNRTGAGDGDDEKITIELNTVPFEVVKIVFTLSIYDVDFQNHNFSMVKNVFFRISNQETNIELFRFELDEEVCSENEGLVIGYLERIGNEWVFHAVGETVKGGLYTIAKEYGIVIAEDAQA
ncbi:MAG: TerD family protein [Pseudomonadota bacterium]